MCPSGATARVRCTMASHAATFVATLALLPTSSQPDLSGASPDGIRLTLSRKGSVTHLGAVGATHPLEHLPPGALSGDPQAQASND
jgi:hypothetical protein